MSDSDKFADAVFEAEGEAEMDVELETEGEAEMDAVLEPEEPPVEPPPEEPPVELELVVDGDEGLEMDKAIVPKTDGELEGDDETEGEIPGPIQWIFEASAWT